MSTQKHPNNAPAANPSTAEPSLNRRILALAVPAFGALIAEPIFVLTDSALIGQLGKAELAGMSIASTLVTTVVGLMNFLAYSVTPAVARAFGEKNLRRAWQIGVDGVWVAFGLGMLLMIAGYACAASARPTKPSATPWTTCTIRCGVFRR